MANKIKGMEFEDLQLDFLTRDLDTTSRDGLIKFFYEMVKELVQYIKLQFLYLAEVKLSQEHVKEECKFLYFKLLAKHLRKSNTTIDKMLPVDAVRISMKFAMQRFYAINFIFPQIIDRPEEVLVCFYAEKLPSDPKEAQKLKSGSGEDYASFEIQDISAPCDMKFILLNLTDKKDETIHTLAEFARQNLKAVLLFLVNGADALS